MGIFHLVTTAAFPVLNVLLVTSVGFLIACESVGILGEVARNHLNDVIYFVFNPALLSSNLARSMTPESIAASWFIPANILLTFLFGSAFGLLAILLIKPASHLKSLVLCTCAAGNVGNMLLVIIPDTCKEKSSPFGAPDVCQAKGLAFASLSLAINQLLTWSCIYNIIQRSSKKKNDSISGEEQTQTPDSHQNGAKSVPKDFAYVEDTPSLSIAIGNDSENTCHTIQMFSQQEKESNYLKDKQQTFRTFATMSFKYVLTPSTIGVITGLVIGVSYPIKKLLIGDGAPLRVIQNSATLLGNGAVPTMTLIMGGNIVKGFQKANIKPSVVIAVVTVRYVLLPAVGIGIVKAAALYGLVHADPLYKFTLLLHFALPPSVYIGTIAQYFGTGEVECAVIFLWSFAAALVFLPVWFTFFIWLVS